MKTTKKKKQTVNTSARGWCVIPGDRLEMVNKVVKRLQADGITFLMEDADELTYGELRRTDGNVYSSAIGCDRVAKIKQSPGTRIIWPDPEACEGVCLKD